MPVKLTKKQQKATAFRERKTKPASDPFPEQDLNEQNEDEAPTPSIAPVVIEEDAPVSKKRKRATEDETPDVKAVDKSEKAASKKAPAAAKDPARKRKKPSKPESTAEPTGDQAPAGKQRFILFLGDYIRAVLYSPC